MKTEDFIHRLAAERRPPTHGLSLMAIAGAVGFTLAATVFIAASGVRGDIDAATLPTALKIAFGLLR